MNNKQGGDQHTQGEWDYRINHLNLNWEIQADGVVIGEIYSKDTTDERLSNESEANAKLIASAPLLAQENVKLKEVNEKMLEALKLVTKYYHGIGVPEALAAIKLAE